MNGRLLYHNRLVPTEIERDGAKLKAYSDDFSGNQDPYIWQEVFLHTYCHMGQMRNGWQGKPKNHPEVKRGDILFWITSDTREDYSKLYCDLVFVVADKVYWRTPNDIGRGEPPAQSDSDAAFEEHYSWVKQHCFSDEKIKKYKRFTLKADPCKSFQPQDADGNLCDIYSFLEDLLGEEDTKALEKALGTKGSYSRPFVLKAQEADDLYAKVLKEAHFHRTGTYFAHSDFEQQRKSQMRQQTPPSECPQQKPRKRRQKSKP